MAECPLPAGCCWPWWLVPGKHTPGVCVHECVRVHQGTEETISFVSEESGGGDNDAYPSPLFSSSEDPAQKILQGPSVEDLAQRYRESEVSRPRENMKEVVKGVSSPFSFLATVFLDLSKPCIPISGL